MKVYSLYDPSSPLSATTGEKIPPCNLGSYFKRHKVLIYCACLVIAEGDAETNECIMPISYKKKRNGVVVEAISQCFTCNFSSIFIDYLTLLLFWWNSVVHWSLFYELEHCTFRAFNNLLYKMQDYWMLIPYNSHSVVNILYRVWRYDSHYSIPVTYTTTSQLLVPSPSFLQGLY